jgi:hypothetical protein
VARIVIDALGLGGDGVEIRYTGASPVGGGGWPGDTAHVAFDTSALAALGWRPRQSAEEAVRAAATGIAAWYRDTGRPLETAAERRAGRVMVGAMGP